MSEAAPARRGRPSTGARERILEGGLEVMKAEGYAGTSLAKVAARAGESKALVAYHFGSKQGLVAAVASEVADEITVEVLAQLGEGEDVGGVIANAAAGVDRVLDRDERIARVYFDLAAVSVVEPEVRKTIGAMNEAWRNVLIERLNDTGLTAARARVLTLMIMAGLEGFALQRLAHGVTPELRKARAAFVAAATEAFA